MIARVLALALLGGAASLEPSWECAHGTPYIPHAVNPEAEPWTANAELKEHTLKIGLERFIAPKRFTVDLDKDPYDRWMEVSTFFAPNASIIVDYLTSFVPDALMPLLLKIFNEVGDEYVGFGDFAAEMHGVADGLGIDYGYVVMGNLAYQLERIGVTCDNWNNTGPTGQCPEDKLNLFGTPTDPAEVVWLDSRHLQQTRAKHPQGGPMGQCSSIVAADSEGQVFHARNLDWNLEHDLRELIIDVDFIKSSQGEDTIFSGTTIASFVGVLNGMRYSTDKAGETGWSYSMDARCQGGQRSLKPNAFGIRSGTRCSQAKHTQKRLCF